MIKWTKLEKTVWRVTKIVATEGAVSIGYGRTQDHYGADDPIVITGGVGERAKGGFFVDEWDDHQTPFAGYVMTGETKWHLQSDCYVDGLWGWMPKK